MSTQTSPLEAHLDNQEKLEAMSDSPSESRPASQISAAGSAAAFNPGWRFMIAFSSLSIITLMAALDATSLSVALPIMARLLHGSALEAFWAGTSFLLTSTVFQPVLGNFSTIFGRKPVIFFSLAMFGVGAIVAAVAKNFTVILVGRSIQGIGGGGIVRFTRRFTANWKLTVTDYLD
jgi:predicted MFS family arabinose efflux permease